MSLCSKHRPGFASFRDISISHERHPRGVIPRENCLDCDMACDECKRDKCECDVVMDERKSE
jgi:hypothetical protein